VCICKADCLGYLYGGLVAGAKAKAA